ncbi:hypothetical protein BC827DRAFT_1269213 [Russula dissimulans]|nr:hypothetical protein BC827DRAFT_1269213 [Russula dissimulans]
MTGAGNRSDSGHRPAVAADSSDDEDTARDREREAEEKRKERRRSEAMSAIDLGNIINGTGPIVDDDDDDEESLTNQCYNIPFPTAVGPMGPLGQWGMYAAVPLGNPLAIAQQAMRDAAEWERGIAIDKWLSRRSSVGTPSMPGMGMGLNMNAIGGGGGGGMAWEALH